MHIDFHENLEDYNTRKEKKALDMIADLEANIKLNCCSHRIVLKRLKNQ